MNASKSPLNSSMQTTTAQSDEIDLMAVLGTLWRRKWLICVITTLFLALGGLYAFKIATPQYESTTSILDVQDAETSSLSSELGAIGGLIGINGASQGNNIETKLEIIQSRTILKRLIAELNLLEDPEFNKTLAPMSIVEVFLNSILQRGDPEPPTEEEALNSTISNVRNAISAESIRSTNVFEISVIAGDREKSENIANTLTQIFVNYQAEVERDDLDARIDWLSDRVVDVENEISQREESLKTLRATTALVAPEALVGLNRQLIDVRDRLTEVQQAVLETQEQLDTAEDLLASEDYDQLSELLGNRSLEPQLPGAVPNQATSRQNEQSRSENMVGDVRRNLNRLRSQEISLRRSAENIERDLNTQADDLFDQTQLEREIETLLKLQETFILRLQDSIAQTSLSKEIGRVISEATLGNLVAPRKSLILALSLTLGLFMGSGFVLARDALKSGFRSPTELEDTFALPILGHILKIPKKHEQDVVRYLDQNPTSAFSESVANLRTSLILSDPAQPPKIIMLTSASDDEGAATTAISLAHNFAQFGRKTLLIEGNIRHLPVSQLMSEVAPKHGLGDIVSGEHTVYDVIASSDDLPFDILFGTKSSKTGVDIFSSDEFFAAIEDIRKTYDVVIIDTPPAVESPDAKILGQHADAIILATVWNEATQPLLNNTIRQFKTANLRILGFVLARYDTKIS